MHVTERDAGRGPVFVVGAARSGTTLTYHLLLASGAFPLYMAEVKVMEASLHYGPLTRQAERERFLSDFLMSRQFARSGWDADELRRRTHEEVRDYATFLRLFMDGIAVRQGRKRWAAKLGLAHLDRVGAAFPDARFLHVVRDGRDVALSRLRLGWTAGWLRSRASRLAWELGKWARQVRGARAAGGRLGERYLEFRYEDLIQESDRLLPRIGRFAGVHLDRTTVERRSLGTLDGANTAYEEGLSGLSRSAVHRWKETLTSAEAAVADRVVGVALDELGYERAGGQAAGPELLPALAAGRLAGPVDAAKSWLKRETPLRRFASSPLEIGLD